VLIPLNTLHVKTTRRIFIHVGTCKTGTTSIQTFLTNNSCFLQRFGFRYSTALTLGPTHHLLAGNYLRLHSDINLLERNIEVVTKELEAHSEHLIISSEYFHGNTEEEYAMLRQLLEPYGDIHAIIYFRRQDTYVEAWFNQVVKSGYYETNIYGLYRDVKNERALDYKHVASRLEALCPVRNIHVRSYDCSRNSSDGVLYDFLTCIGIPRLADTRMPQMRLNPSFSATSIALIHLIHKRLGKEHADVFMSKPPEWFPPSGISCFFSPVERALIVHCHAQNNREMVQKFCPEKEDFFDPMSPADLETSGPAISEDELEGWFEKAVEHLIC